MRPGVPLPGAVGGTQDRGGGACGAHSRGGPMSPKGKHREGSDTRPWHSLAPAYSHPPLQPPAAPPTAQRPEGWHGPPYPGRARAGGAGLSTSRCLACRSFLCSRPAAACRPAALLLLQTRCRQPPALLTSLLLPGSCWGGCMLGCCWGQRAVPSLGSGPLGTHT